MEEKRDEKKREERIKRRLTGEKYRGEEGCESWSGENRNGETWRGGA